MSAQRIVFIIFLLAIFPLTISCSSGENSKEKGAIEKTTDKIAQEATDMIKKPISEAKGVAEIANDRTRQFEEAKKQE